MFVEKFCITLDASTPMMLEHSELLVLCIFRIIQKLLALALFGENTPWSDAIKQYFNMQIV